MDITPTNAELMIGLVARIGVDTSAVVRSLTRELKKYKYEVEEVHLTDLIKPFANSLDIKEGPVEERYNSYIAACNILRQQAGNEIMASLAIGEIATRRGGVPPVINVQVRTAYIINQIKRPEESELLRDVYGEHYIQISCHAGHLVRVQRLTDRIIKGHPEEPKNPKWDLSARELINKDESEEDEPHGQRVQKVFPLSDLILNAETTDLIKSGIDRFLRSLFGDQSVTPTPEEYGMELANTAAQRSSDLSRQVGASILSKNREVRALGCNEVPRSGGGTYWEGDQPDGRDFAMGGDANEQRRRAMIMDLMLRLEKAGALREHLRGYDVLEKCVFDRDDSLIEDAQIMDSMEYGRSVHAEMNAITDATRVGNSVQGCILFTNTFPCHNCAKHIVAAGIEEVVFIKPYPKSYTKELFNDSILVGELGQKERRVLFRQFSGVAGPMYARVFTKARWKRDGGVVAPFEKAAASYIRRTPIPGYPATEILIIEEFEKALRAKGYWPNSPTEGADVTNSDPPRDAQ